MPRPKMHWNAAMIDALKQLRAQGTSSIECAERIGVCSEVVQQKCRELGIDKRMNRGFISGRDNRV